MNRMCGCCRVSVDGKIKFACVDGPDFDGLQVDFDELMLRQRMFRKKNILLVKMLIVCVI